MTWRYRFSLIMLIAAFGAIIARLFYWQVVKAEELSWLGESQHGTFIKLTPQRGEIKTSDGFPIAANKVAYLAFANPKVLKDKEKVVDVLSPILAVDGATVSAKLSLDKYWVPLRSSVDAKTKEMLERKNISGIGFQQESERFYPEASLSAHLLGFVGKDELGDPKGYFGLEGYYDRQLRGKAGRMIQIHDAFGKPILANTNEKTIGVDGRTLVLSIDRAMQFIVEDKLKAGIEKYQAAGGMAAVIEPRTGSLLAMTSFPSFDPQTYSEFDDVLYKNPFISNLYEPGSTFKSLVMAAAIDAKVVEPHTRCTICGGSVSIGGYEIETWNNKYQNGITMIDVIRRSDNIGMVFVGKRLGFDRLFSYLDRFGIGKLTGIDLQGEVAPDMKPKDAWYPIDVATVSFGQGITVTPIELLAAFASIANGGNRMEQHVVKRIETPGGGTLEIKPKVLDKPISSATAKVMTEILVNAVNKGEAKWAKPKGYRIAGKTGTAQIPIAGHYDPNKTIASFIGFAPADDPKFAMLVIVDRPTTSIYGSETAAPIFFDIAKDILTYYGIPPTE